VNRKLIETLQAQLAADRAMQAVVTAILDRCDRYGAMPARMTLPCGSPEEQDAAVRLLSAAAVRPLADNSLTVRLDLARADTHLRAEGWPGLAEVLYTASGRGPRNLRAEAEKLAKDASERAIALAERHVGAARSFLLDLSKRVEEHRGELYELARSQGLSCLEDELELLASCIELAEQNDQPLRLANFSRRAANSTKAVRPGDRRYTHVVDALLDYVPGLAERVAVEDSADLGDRRRLALECLNIFRNETPIDVLCYGHLVLEKRGRRLETAAVHRQLGEPVRLLLLHLRDAQVVEARAERVISIENETTFNDYVDWLRTSGREEIALLSEGQANWAVVRLLRMLKTANPSLPLQHWGDLDRFGVLILRSLRRRSCLPIEPLWMDVATFERHVAAGIPLVEGEREEIARLLLASPDDIGGDLLRAIRSAGRWVEQETVAEDALDLGGPR